MLYGYAGKILHVDLSSHKLEEKNIAPEFARRFFGGLGFNSKILYDEVTPRVDPLGPDNIVIIAPGALCGTSAPTAARTEVTTKSPLTGIMGSGNFGGYWGPALKRAGYDAVVIKGKSKEPVYLCVDNDRVQIREAAHLWGGDTFATCDALRKELGEGVSVLSIGQAGENLVRFANVIADRHYAAGRCHAGAVLGSKRLKAIAVRGNNQIPIHSPSDFEHAKEEIAKRIISYPGWKTRQRSGSIGNTNPALSAAVAQYLTKGPKYSYCHCPLGEYYGCTLTADIRTGKYAGTKIVNAAYTHYAEYVKGMAIDFPAAWKIKETANRYGMDSHAGRFLFLIRIFEKGIINKKDTGGLDLVRGNPDAVIELMRRIAQREGLGDVLAEGMAKSVEEIGGGAEEELLTVKGAAVTGVLPPFEVLTRMKSHLGVLTCPRGGDDLKNQHALHDFPGIPTWAREMNRSEQNHLEWLLDWLDMPQNVKERIFGASPHFHTLSDLNEPMITVWYGNLTCAYDTLGLCMFAVNSTNVIGPTHCGNLFSAATGWDVGAHAVMDTGERVFNLMRAYLVREDMRRKDDDWPERFHGELLPRERIDKLLDQYYELRSWDIKTGIPTAKKLSDLQLDDVVEDLAERGMINR